MFKRIPGTRDILPEEAILWQKIEETSRNIFSFYNYQEIKPPLLEEAGLFNRSLGEAAEIVQKQMFLVQRGQDLYALRPEGTASIVRAYIQNNLDKTGAFVKFYYIGPMFRAERPQKGRLRQFHHIGSEVIGSGDPALDVEIISLVDTLLKAYAVSGYEINLNNLGCRNDKKALADKLRGSLKARIAKFCPDCQARFKTNALRILDCKNESCRSQFESLGLGNGHLCSSCKSHFSSVRAGLDDLGVAYRINPYLVRGLDYYTRTVFEITHKDLGAQDALGAGGRYDNLVKDLGGPDVGAIGFAFGIERLLLVRSQEPGARREKLVYVIALGDQAKKAGLKILDNLRRNKIPCDTDYEGKSLKGALRQANDLKASQVVIMGEDELKKGIVALKDMVSGEQKEVKQEDLISELRQA